MFSYCYKLDGRNNAVFFVLALYFLFLGILHERQEQKEEIGESEGPENITEATENQEEAS